MKKQIQTFLKIAAVAGVMSIFIGACKDDDNDVVPTLTGQSKTYVLSSVSNPAISGTVKFAERSDNATIITIDLDGTTSANTPVAHIHQNTAAETGPIILDLSAINGTTGLSETVVTKLNDGTSISYSQLLALNGYVNVHLSADELATLIAQGDIGENELTATSAMYSLNAVNGSGVDGTVTFTKRANATTLAVIDLNGASATGSYPIYIYDNDVATTGPIAIDLNNVNGATGMSATTIRKLNNNTAITYDQLIGFDGHINVGTSATDATYLAQGNIGSN